MLLSPTSISMALAGSDTAKATAELTMARLNMLSKKKNSTLTWSTIKAIGQPEKTFAMSL